MADRIYKIFSPPPLRQLENLPEMLRLSEQEGVREAIFRANHPYLHWEQLRYKSWIPESLFPDKGLFWQALKVMRGLSSTSTPLRDKEGHYFRMNVKDYAEFLHTIDKEMAGNFMGVTGVSESDKKQFVTRSIIEESIASSQLEGANTSRAVAKKMLLEGRKPQTHGEQMIVNNHQAMLRIERELCKEPLSLELLCELHRMITDKTLEEGSQGKLRETFDKNGQRLKVIKPDDGKVAYIVPDKEFVEAELPRLIHFANTNEGEFIHPLIKAIMLHFWIGLLHPFEDGNGRLARILFYWYMLKNEYWAFAYLSLSEKIKKSPAQYMMAYIYSEQDDNDLTYFIDYNIRQLKLARTEFQSYIQKKVEEKRAINFTWQEELHFNERQIRLLQYLHQHRSANTNIIAHQKLYAVKKNTAIADLKQLCESGFLVKKKRGRNVHYYPTEKVGEIFKS
jgi:Fic family protein